MENERALATQNEICAQRLAEQNAGKRFVQWLQHRTRVVGLRDLQELSIAAGISPAALFSIERTGSLRAIGRTNRSCLSRALRVSLRELESLATGKIKWIEDHHCVDPPSLSPGNRDMTRPAIGSFQPPMAPSATAAEEGRGIPIVGTFCDWRDVQWDAIDEHPLRLLIRYTGMPEAFALRVSADTSSRATSGASMLVFQSVPPIILQVDERVLLTCADGSVAGFTCIGKLATASQSTWTKLISLESDEDSPGLEIVNIESESIVRAARWIAAIQNM